MVNEVPVVIDETMVSSSYQWIVPKLAEDIHGLLKNYKKCEGEIVNVSSGNSISLKTIIEFYRNKLNSNSAINYGVLPYRENKFIPYVID